MDSLKFYIKENRPLVVFYGICLFVEIFVFAYDIYRMKSGYIDRIMMRFMLCSIIFLPGMIFYLKDCIKLVLVYLDYYKKIKETKTFFVKTQTVQICKNEYDGVYDILYCADDRNGKFKAYWRYKKDLLYDEIIGGNNYKITYYKYSKCICNIEPAFDVSKIKRNKKTKLQKRCKKAFLHNESSIKNLKTNHLIEKQESIKGKFITDGIPVKLKSGKYNYFLKVRNENGQKKVLFFNHTDTLGLGCLNERPGYLGYGNFIGMDYEIEYYKKSREIKSMKPGQSDW